VLLLFALTVTFLSTGASNLTLPFEVLIYSVVIFIGVPLALDSLSRVALPRKKCAEWFENRALPTFQPLTIIALLATPALIFAFQAENLTSRFFHVVLIGAGNFFEVAVATVIAWYGPQSGAALATRGSSVRSARDALRLCGV